jgi:hypothetical protein
MKLKFILIFVATWSATSNAQENYLRPLRLKAKFPDTIVVKNVTKYNDGTICGQWNAKDSYGLYVGYSDFVFRRNELYSEELNGNPYCSNLPKKELMHPVWVRLNELSDRRSKAFDQISSLERRNKTYCTDVAVKSLCDTSNKENNIKVPALQSEISMIENEINAATEELKLMDYKFR